MGLGARMLLGGALQGLGAGIAAKGQADAEERRQIALENLRAKNQSEKDARDHSNEKDRLTQQYGLMDTNNAKQTARETDAAIVKDNVRTKNDITIKGVEHKQKVELTQIDFKNDQAMANLQGAIQRSNTAASQRLAKDLESGEVTQLFEGGDGTYYQMRRDGTITTTGIATPVKETSKSGSVLDRAREARQGGASPAPKASAPAKAAEPSKTYTQADAVATAKKHGVSVDAVHARMRQAGYKLSAN